MKKLFIPALAVIVLFSCTQTNTTLQVEKATDGVFIHITQDHSDPHRVLMPFQMALMMAEKSLHEMTTEELGELFPVILQQYNPLWAHLFNSEKELITSLFQPSEIISIEHIGSTAIPGILPKNTKTTGRHTLKQNMTSFK